MRFIQMAPGCIAICWIAATAATSHREVNLLLLGRVIRYKRSFLFGDRFELPSDTKVGLEDLLGFKLQLAPRT